MEPKIHFYKGLSARGFHNIRYLEWGESLGDSVVLCVHGLSRNAHDFDYVARALAKAGHRVICPDLPGRGGSDWLGDPSQYVYTQYMSDLTALIARVNVEKIHWIGTSMGGLIGWLMSIQQKSPIQSLLMNDVGAFISKESLARIQKYVGNPPIFRDVQHAESYMRQALSTFGIRQEEHWQHLLKHSIRVNQDATAQLTYDPQIANAAVTSDAEFWALWQMVICPVMVLRGANSDVLTKEVADKMQEIKPQMRFAEIADCGHAPALMDDEQIQLVLDWISSNLAFKSITS